MVGMGAGWYDCGGKIEIKKYEGGIKTMIMTKQKH